jgi:N6-adenosine-specific RNA methylase IME4|tara:strand:- start:8899 stop:9438 length:540 start_codon:yes stop_codon:yes gene_type:complete
MSKIYSTIMADPPWYQRGGGKSKRGADRHYDILKEHEIKAVMSKMLQGKVAENAHMYMWVANNHLAEGLRILEHLEFRYITNLVWAKPSFGLGRYFRGQHEICLFATRGRGFSVRSEANNVSTLIGGSMIKPTKHSAKPQEIYDLVESRSKGSYLELFARNSRPGWDCLGNEAPSEENE